MKSTLVLLACIACTSALAEELPVSVFGRLPMIEQPTVSPDGGHVAAVLNADAGPTLVISKFGSTELNAIVRLKFDEHRIEWIDWANNERVLISVSEPVKQASATFRVSRLYQVGLDGEGMKQIRRKSSYTDPQWVQVLDTDNILSMLPQKPDHILMQVWDGRDQGFAVFEVEFAKNKFKKMFANTYDVDSWWADENGNVFFGIEFNENTNEVTSWYRPEGDKKWRELYTRKAYEGETFSPLFVSNDKAIILTDYDLGRQAVWQYDLLNGEYDQVLFEVEGYDVAGSILSNDRSELLGVYYYDHFRRDHYFDAAARQRDDLIKSSFPGYRTTIVSRSLDEQRMMVSLVNDNLPPKYVWVDLGNKAAGTWYSQYPDLEGKLMPKVTPIEFEARDGTALTGYLTLPLQYEGDQPKLVVHPHGGPSSRDYQYFDYWVQFLANRGYAVLQVNFRGSEGFGSAHETAGYRQWGQDMQQDVYDAVDWLAQQDLVDTDSKCIVGASYGGYVALTAAFQRPDEYQCIASFAGIADLYEMARMESLDTFKETRHRDGNWRPV